MDKELLELLPSEAELAQLSKKVKQSVTSRGQLLIAIDKLDLQKTALEERMIYVLGLISLGFDEKNARLRLNVSNAQMYIWKQDTAHKEMLDNARARGEMLYEEKILSEAETNPKMALEVLKEIRRRNTYMEGKENGKKENAPAAGSLENLISEGEQRRGLKPKVVVGEILDERLK